MKVPFRQGLINYQVDGFGQQQFLVASTTPNFVGLNVAPTPTVATFAHGSSNYLQVFAADVSNAWGPIPPGVTAYLYWDIDLLTSNVTYGFTTLDAVISSTAPADPPAPVGPAVLHWFDTTTTTMKVWTGARWQNVVRVFAGRVNGSINSITAEPKGTSWRGILPVEARTGYISTDVFGNPLRTVAGEFVTSETPIRFRDTVGTSGVLAVLPNAFVPVRASENIPAMSLVYFSGEGTVGLASGNAAILPSRTPIGVVQDELGANEVGNVTLSGEISYDQWDWSGHIGQPLYCGSSGQIVTHRPVGLLAYRVGFVKAAKTILFQVDAETLPQVYQSGTSEVVVDGIDPITTSFAVSPLGEKVWTVELQPASASGDGYMTQEQAQVLDGLDGRLSQAEEDILGRALIEHGHVIADVTGLQAALDGKAAVNHNHDDWYASVTHSHVIADVTGLQAALDGKVNIVPTAVTGNLARFTVVGGIEDAGLSLNDLAFVNHTHTITNITGLQTALDGKASVTHNHVITNITGLQVALDGKASVTHSHVIADVTGLQVVLDSKASVTHSHVIANITGLQTALDSKASVTHSHVIADVTGLQVVLDSKASVTHNHVIADVTGLQVALDGKASVTHNHALSTLTDVTITGATAGQALVFNGSAWVNSSVTAGASALGDLTDVSLFYGAVNGDVLTFNSSAQQWEAQQPTKQVKPKPMTLSSITTPGTYNFGSALHHNWHVRSTSPTDVTITIQPDSFWTGTQSYFDENYNPSNPQAASVGESMLIGKHGNGNVTIAAGPGVTINTPDTLVISRLHGKAVLIKVGPNEWDLEGNIGI